MEKMIQVILVEHNPASQKEIEKNIREAGITNQVKIALNGGHALLYLDHLHLTDKVKDNQVIILLNLDTPLVDGLSFLKDYQASKNFKKENIQIAVIDDNLSADKKAKAESMGVSCFLSPDISAPALNNLVNTTNRTPVTSSAKNSLKPRYSSMGSSGMSGHR